MPTYFGSISATQGFGKPISLYIEINGYHEFVEFAKETHTKKIAPYLQEKKWIITSSVLVGIARAGNDSNALIEYATVAKDVGLEDRLDQNMPVKKTEVDGKETYVPNYALQAHEENHKEVMSLGLWDKSRYTGSANAYFDILTESLAEVISDLATLSHHDNKKAVREDMRRRSTFGQTLLGIVSDAQHGKSHPDLAERIKNGYAAVSPFRENPNWTDILHDVKYYGLYGVCLDLICSYGEEKGKEIIYEAMLKLQDTPDARGALAYLQENLPDPTPIPLINETSVAFCDEAYDKHIAFLDGSRFELKIWCRKDDKVALGYLVFLIAKTKLDTDRMLAAHQSS